jgi:hypothetical protein
MSAAANGLVSVEFYVATLMEILRGNTELFKKAQKYPEIHMQIYIQFHVAGGIKSPLKRSIWLKCHQALRI